MSKLGVLVLAASLLVAPTLGAARGDGGRPSHSQSAHSSSRHSSAPHATSRGTHRITYSARTTRDSHGENQRSSSSKSAFKKGHPCPSTGKSSGACPGYVIDHVMPLKRGGADDPSHMQWQLKGKGEGQVE
jgi:hypothetical protein